MITVIERDSSMAVNANPYPGMSLAEACENFMIESNNLANDLQMSVLLTEHQYLFENKTEIQYVNEEGKITEKGAELKAKAIAAWERFAAMAAELWDKIITKVQEVAAAVTKKLLEIGINKKHVEIAKNVLGQNKVEANFAQVDWKGLTDSIRSTSVFVIGEDIANHREQPDILKFIGETKLQGVDPATFEAACNVIFVKDNFIKELKAAKKSCNDNIKKEIGRLKKERIDNSDIEEDIKNCKAAIQFNNKVVSDSVKVANARLNNAVKVIKAGFGAQAVKKAIGLSTKEAIKNAPGNVADAAKKAPGKAAEAAKDAGAKAKEAAGKAADKAKDAGVKAAEGARKFFTKNKKEEKAE